MKTEIKIMLLGIIGLIISGAEIVNYGNNNIQMLMAMGIFLGASLITGAIGIIVGH